MCSLNVVSIGAVMLQLWAELLEAQTKLPLLQMSQQSPDDKQRIHEIHTYTRPSGVTQ